MAKNFLIGISMHRVLGPEFVPYIFSRAVDKEYYQLEERVTLGNIKKFESDLGNDELQLVKIIEEYSDSQLVKVFSKKQTSPHDFLAKLEKEFLTERIRPYIEKRLLRCIDILSGSQIPVYFKHSQNNIYESERIVLIEENVESVFNFKRIDGELCYFLSIGTPDMEIKLIGKEGLVLVNEPCRLILENSLYIFDDIDGKKLQPFFTKDSIQVPARAEKKFLEGFVRNVIRNYKVNVEGFTISDKNIVPGAILSLEKDLSGRPVFMLKFRYDEKTVYYANKKSELKVVYNENTNTFIRLNRDYDFENNTIYRLLEIGLKNISGSYFLPLNIKKTEEWFLHYELINWLNYAAEELSDAGIEVVYEKERTNYYLDKLELDIRVSENKSDWFDIHIIVRFSDFEIPFVHFREHILSNNREYELPDGRVAVLPEEWFSRFRDIFAFANTSQQAISLEKQHYVLLQESLKGLKEGYAKKIKKWFEDQKEVAHDLPEGIQATFRPYQLEGYSWMVQLYENGFGGCLADDMGLGKTLQTLAVLKKAIAEENRRDFGPSASTFKQQMTIFDMLEPSKIMKSKPSLIVVPTSLVHNWINEVQKFVPSLNTMYYGGQKRKSVAYYYENADLIVTSYGIVRNDIDLFRNLDFLYVVLDESQLVKNPTSKTYKALILLNATCRLVLTGTPIENSLTDLWAQMNFLNPGLLGTLPFFKNEFSLPIERHDNEEQKRKLRALIKPFMLRRNKNEVARDLPDLLEQTILCDMSENQHRFYESEKSKARNLIMQNIGTVGIEKSSIVILQSLTRLRQIANHPLLVNNEYMFESGKFDEIARNLENIVAEGHKAIVFSFFVKYLELFAGYCRQNNLVFTMLTGETTRRKEAVEQFQEKEDIRIFLISLKAGGYGLNLTAADYVFVLDPWWNPAVEQQALSRAHRIGQEKNVFVYRFITKDSIEEKILKLQERKSSLADAFVNSNNPFKGISEKQVMDLFE